jgi:hypothetical protein
VDLIFQAASDQKRERITAAGDDALWRVGGYLRGTTILSGGDRRHRLRVHGRARRPLALPLAMLVLQRLYPYFGGFVATGIIVIVTYGAVGAGPSSRCWC